MENLNEISRLILEDPDYVYVPRRDYSLKKVVERYPDGLPTRAAAAKALMMSEPDFDKMVASAIVKLREFF